MQINAPQYGDMVQTADRRVGFMHGAGSNLDRVTVEHSDGSRSFHDRASLRLISRSKVHNQPTPEADAIVAEANAIVREMDRTAGSRIDQMVADRIKRMAMSQ